MRLLILFIIAAMFIAVGLLSLNATLLLMAVPFVLLILLGLLQAADTVQLTATRTLSKTQVTAGEPVEITLTIQNDGATIDELHIRDLCPAGLEPEGDLTVLRGLKKGDAAELRWQIKPKRGVWHFPHADVKGSDRFGFFPFEKQLNVQGQIRLTVIFQPEQVGEIAIRPRQTRSFAGTIPSRTAGSGSDFFGVRQYQPGDSLRHVNWRTSARHVDTLFTNEFEQERVADIGMIVDARSRAITVAGNQTLLDYQLDAASAFADSFLKAGNRVGLLVYGNLLNWVLPGYGKIQHQRILEALSNVTAGDSQVFGTFNHLPTRLFPAKSQIVLFSPLLPDDVAALTKIRARGYALMVVTPDAIAWEAAHLPDNEHTQTGTRVARIERSLLLRQLARTGIQIIEWNVEQPLEHLVRTKLRRPPLPGGIA